MLYTYVPKLAYVSRLTKVESQGFILCRPDGYVLNQVFFLFAVVIEKPMTGDATQSQVQRFYLA